MSTPATTHYYPNYPRIPIVRREVPKANAHLLAHIPALLRRIYLARGICNPEELDLSLKQLLKPHGLSGIAKAVELLTVAITEQWCIAIVGDYDADGATASALSFLVLRELGIKNLQVLIPSRFHDGYGLTPKIVAQAAKQGAKLILTVDVGITSYAGIAKAKELGLYVIITDHHLTDGSLPTADAIVNPNIPAEPFMGKNTAGVGVVFYLLAALRQRLKPEIVMADFLDLVALGTVADVVKLDHNNRILVQNGLQRIRSGHCRPGIAALFKIANKDATRATAEDLGFYIGPRLNAAGRMETMDLGLHCLLSNDPNQAAMLAQDLAALNATRRHAEADMQAEASAMVAEGELTFGLCLYDPNWHQGIIGLLAGRLKDRYNRPAIAMTLGEDETIKGSARSIATVHIRDLLANIDSHHPGLLLRYGGHAMAAGLTIPAERFAQFKQAFITAVSEHLHGEPPTAQILSDGSLKPTDITLETAQLLEDAGPWGQGFPAPLFDGEFVVIEQQLLAKNTLKLKLLLDGAVAPAKKISAIMHKWEGSILNTARVRTVYGLNINRYKGVDDLQLVIKYLEPVGNPAIDRIDSVGLSLSKPTLPCLRQA